MKKSFRVKSEQEFEQAFQNGTSFANRQLVIYVYPKPEQAHFRVGFSVGKRVGNAVERNKIKRQLRSLVYELRHEIAPQYDYLIIARQTIKYRNYDQIKSSLIHVMKLASVIEEDK